jgi:hypothetical protein
MFCITSRKIILQYSKNDILKGNKKTMVNICVNVPARLKEGLKLKAQELNLKTSDIIRDALWKTIELPEADSAFFKSKVSSNYGSKNELVEQLYFIRCIVESIALVMDGGGENFVDKCHLHKEKLLKNFQLRSKN